MAERIFGFEGVWSGYDEATELEIVAAPASPSKKVIIAFHVHLEAKPGVLEAVLRKDSTDVLVSHVDGDASEHEDVIQGHTGYITLDADDESLVIKAITGSSDISWSGSYVNVD